MPAPDDVGFESNPGSKPGGKYLPVDKGRNQRVRGVWKRNHGFVVQLTAQAQDGTRKLTAQPKKHPLGSSSITRRALASDGFLDVLTGAMIRRAHEEEFNGPIGEPLALVDLVAQVQSSR